MLEPILLFAVGGFLAGGAWSVRDKSIVLAVALAACAVLAIVAGVLRYP